MSESNREDYFVLDKDSSLNYEKMNFFSLFLNRVILLPIFGLFPSISKKAGVAIKR